MDKNIIIVILVAMIGALAILLIAGNQSNPAATPSTKVDSVVIKAGALEADALNSDAVLFSQDQVLESELDQTLNEVGEMSDETSSSSGTEDIDALSQDAANFSNDEVVNQELDSALSEAAL